MSDKNFQPRPDTPTYFTNERRPTLEPIQTHFIYPPIPIRDYDWVAYRDPERKPYGYGRTEAEAIQNLLYEEENQ